MRDPALVDRMEAAEDADGRVAIFTVDGSPVKAGSAAETLPPGEPPPGQRPGLLDGRYAVLWVGAILVFALLLGLVLLKR